MFLLGVVWVIILGIFNLVAYSGTRSPSLGDRNMKNQHCVRPFPLLKLESSYNPATLPVPLLVHIKSLSGPVEFFPLLQDSASFYRLCVFSDVPGKLFSCCLYDRRVSLLLSCHALRTQLHSTTMRFACVFVF